MLGKGGVKEASALFALIFQICSLLAREASSLLGRRRF
jgi:hypothetical protein